MKPLFINELTASFMLFIDHEVCYNASAFFNLVDEKLFPSVDPNFAGKTIYQSRYRQWIADQAMVSIGATIPTQVKDGSSIVTKSSNDLKFDYNMGRIFLEDAYNKNSNDITATFSVKEFNVFLTSKDETQLFLGDPDDYPYTNKGIEPYIESYPLIYVKYTNSENNPFAFGGMDESTFDFRCCLMAEHMFKFDSLSTVLQDCARKSFPLIPSASIPFDVFGDIKPSCAPYNYHAMCDLFPNNMVYIESVKVSKFTEKFNKLIRDGMWGGFVDFKLKALRYPRLSK